MALIVGPRHVMTCCHVLNDALGRDNRLDPAMPPLDTLFSIRFPYASNAKGSGGIVAWGLELPKAKDIAVLKLIDDAPSAAGVAVFSEAEVQRTKWSCIGWNKEGIDRETQGEFASLLARGERQLNGPSGVAVRIAGGYSGAAVWSDSLEAFVGMVVTTDIDQFENGLAYAIPTYVLSEVWPGLRTRLMDDLIGDGLEGRPVGYLVGLAGRLGQFPWYHERPGSQFFRDLHIQVRVCAGSRDPQYLLEVERQHRQGLRWAEIELDRESSSYRASGDESYYGGNSVATTFPWAASPGRACAREKYRRAVILADPGMGKTTLLRYETWLAATQAVDDLRSGYCSLADIVVPIYLRLDDLRPVLSEGDPVASLVRLATDATHGGVPLSEEGRAALRDKVRRGKFSLMLDAMDEIREGVEDEVLRWVQGVVAAWNPVRVYLSSRHVGYSGCPLTASATEPVAELELVAFRPEDVRNFIHTYFGNQTEGDSNRPLALELWYQLKHSQALLGLAQNPLLLTLMCVAFRHGGGARLQLPNTRSEVYRTCLRGLLGRWPRARRTGIEPRLKPSDERTVDLKVEMLARVAWGLASADPDRALFTRNEVEGGLRQEPALLQQLGWEVSRALDELTQRDGVLVAIGQGETARYTFLHRTFQEYLVAWAMGRQADGTGEALRHVYDPAWSEVLILLGGVLAQQDQQKPSDPGRVRQLLRLVVCENRNDLLCRPLLLAGQIAGEAGGAVLELLRPFAQKFTAIHQHASWLPFRKTLDCLAGMPAVAAPFVTPSGECDLAVSRATIATLTRLGQATPTIIEVVLRGLRERNPWVRRESVEALERLGGDDSEVILALCNALQDEDEMTRNSAAWVLRQQRQIVPHLVESILAYLELPNQQAYHRENAIEALGKLGLASPQVIKTLLEALQVQHSTVRAAAATALGKLGQASPEIVRSLLVMVRAGAAQDSVSPHSRIEMRDDPTSFWGFALVVQESPTAASESAATALGKLCQVTPEVIETLLHALQFRSTSMSRAASEALARLTVQRWSSGLP